MSVSRRVISTLSLGYVLFFYSEVMFWSRLRAEDTPHGMIMTWLAYSVLAFFVLLSMSRFAGDVHSTFLVGWYLAGSPRESWFEVNAVVALSTSSVGIFLFLGALYRACRIHSFNF
ncbi:hypothetical protein E3E22_07735 [Thermococcus sp. MV5]|uniref:hypothetical protein n=1 Tax=Thermococcus sp. MV5 TaxID=1638272 RepID=UPI00143C61CB|nr:hypothetical protein [Thermococcus sp. MV5]NJE26506.1 hypothetical protein [Thermococcus sp. MV5]